MPVHFVGREDLVERLVRRLISGGSVALSAEGLPGVGKTTLAVALANRHEVLAHFTDGVLWAGLGRQPDAMGTLAAWGDALGVDVTRYAEPLQRAQAVKDAISQRRFLLVIDDAWHEDAALLLRCGGPNCCHLLTTRDDWIAQAFAGEAGKAKVPVLEEEPAFDLLRRIAPRACAANPEAARELARTVDGLPLALELLGAYLAPPTRSQFPELSDAAFAELADPNRRRELATRRLGDLRGEEVTLRETILLSLEALPAQAVTAFYALGAFAPKPESFDLDAAVAVAENDPETIAVLVEKNLVEHDGRKLALHQTIRELACHDMPKEAQSRHARHYLARAEAAADDWRKIEEVYGQIKWAFDSVMDDDETSFLFINSLAEYQQLRGLWADSLHWNERGLAAAEKQQHTSRIAALLNTNGLNCVSVGQREKALQLFERALPMMQEVGDGLGEANVLNNIGLVYHHVGQREKALQYFERALALMQEDGYSYGVGVTLNNIGSVFDSLGQREKALQYYERALPIRQEAGDRSGEAGTLTNIGRVYHHMSQPERALQYFERALPIHQEAGIRPGEAINLSGIGLVYDSLGQSEQSFSYYERALSITQEVGDRAEEATTLNNIGLAHLQLGRHDKALQYFESALPIQVEIGNRSGEALLLCNIGGAYHKIGQLTKALQYLERALPIMQEVGDRSAEAATLNNLGGIYDDLGQRETALQYYERALPIMQEVGNCRGEAIALSNIGQTYDKSGQWAKALQYYDRALPIHQQSGDRSGEAVTRFSTAMILRRRGDLEGAVKELRRVVELDALVQHRDLERDRAVLAETEEKWGKQQQPKASWWRFWER
ncbi:MAG: tetratricopeptide repeat protein [Gemmatimonadota bacterium]